MQFFIFDWRLGALLAVSVLWLRVASVRAGAGGGLRHEVAVAGKDMDRDGQA